MTAVKTYIWLSPEKLQFINSHPEVLSILYDLGLLPEEISAHVRGFVEEEREQCAKIAERFAEGAQRPIDKAALMTVADLIRKPAP